MGATNRLSIPGCKPSLLGFLKALGLLKTIYLQFDKNVKGFWDGEAFVIETCLEKGELLACFSKRYEPLPILSPFTTHRDGLVFEKLDKSPNPRLEQIKKAYQSLNNVKDILPNQNSPFPSTRWLQHIEKQLEVLPSAFVPSYKSLAMYFCGLGEALKNSTGSFLYGNYQSSFAKLRVEENYLNALSKLIDFDSAAQGVDTKKQLLDSLFAETKKADEKTPSKTYHFNRWEEIIADFKGNPWDFVFVLNGLVALCKDYPLFSEVQLPFFLEAVGARWNIGNENPLQKVIQKELWLPLWNSPLSYQDLTKLLTKFAININESHITSALDLTFEGAIWGINSLLSRFLRLGLSFDDKISILPEVINFGFVTLDDTKFPESISAIRAWMNSLQEYLEVSPKTCKQNHALKDLEISLFAYLISAEKSFLPSLINLGVFHKMSSLRPRTRRPKPLVLPHQILEIASEDTPEFRIALAIASLDFVQPVRPCFEPVFQTDGGSWEKSDLSKVLSGDLIDKLCQLIEVKVQYAKSHNLKSLALTSYHPANRSDVELYLTGKLNDSYLESLLYGLILINYPRPEAKPAPKPQSSTLLDFHLLLRSAFLSSTDYDTLLKLIRKLRFSSLTESLNITKELCPGSNYHLAPQFQPSLNLNQRVLSSIVIDCV